MKIKYILLFILSILNIKVLYSQIVIDNFSGPLTNWTNTFSSGTLTNSGAELNVNMTTVDGGSFQEMTLTFPTPQDFSSTPVICFDLKVPLAAPANAFNRLDIRLVDNLGVQTNNATSLWVLNPPTRNGSYVTYCMDYTGKFKNSSNTPVNSTQIKKIIFYVNGGSNWVVGDLFYMDNLTRKPSPPAFISNVGGGSGAGFLNQSFVLPTDSAIYRLTDDNGNFQRTSVFFNRLYDFDNDFDKYFNVYFGCYDAIGADGLTFAIQNAGLDKVGGGGGAMGYGISTLFPLVTFPNSVGIEFDTWDNTVNGITNDIPSDHLAVDLNGDENGMMAGSRVNLGNIEDNVIHLIRIQYIAATKKLSIYIDGVAKLSNFTVDIGAKFPAGKAYWGWTASTGGNMNEQWFSYNGTPTPPTYSTACSDPLPVELISFSGYSIDNKTVKLDWSTAVEINNKEFKLMRSVDSREWVELGIVKGKGNSGKLVDYTFIDYFASKNTNYYQLIQVDQDDKKKLSSIIVVNLDHNETEVVIYPNPVTDVIKIRDYSIKGSMAVELINNIGEVVFSEILMSKEYEYEIVVRQYPRGMYMLRTISGNKISQSKIMLH